MALNSFDDKTLILLIVKVGSRVDFLNITVAEAGGSAMLLRACGK